MKLRFTPQAIDDLENIATNISERDPQAALRVRKSILDSLAFLTRYPEAGRRQTVEPVRKMVTRQYAYVVYYSVDREADEIVVLSIQHPAQERPFEDM